MPILLLERRLTASFTHEEAALMCDAISAIEWSKTSLSAVEYGILLEMRDLLKNALDPHQ